MPYALAEPSRSTLPAENIVGVEPTPHLPSMYSITSRWSEGTERNEFRLAREH
jgi:hypothetical protein